MMLNTAPGSLNLCSYVLGHLTDAYRIWTENLIEDSENNIRADRQNTLNVLINKLVILTRYLARRS